jgi:hypothetical protein
MKETTWVGSRIWVSSTMKPPKIQHKARKCVNTKRDPTSESPWHVLIEEKVIDKTH